MGCLSIERTGLADHFHVVAVHLAFVGRDGGMRISVVGLDAEPVEIFQDVDFHTKVLCRTEIHRFVFQILSFSDQTVFDRVLDILVEQTHHELFALSGEIFVTQVQIVGYGVLQVGIAFLLVIIADDAVRGDFEETRPVDGAGI